jgi:phage gpG-like protein
MMIRIEFLPWHPFKAHKDPTTVRRWLKVVADASEKAFKNMGSYPPASSPGDYPAVRTGRLRGSIKTEITDTTMTIGSNMPYSIYLRMGTGKMARRKMSDNALQEGMQNVNLGRWVHWKRL